MERSTVLATRFRLARAAIIEFFENQSRRVYKRRELERVFSENHGQWAFAPDVAFSEFLAYLVKGSYLWRIEFPFPHRKEVRYTWGKLPLEAVLPTLKPGCHFSHYTAVQLHDLTEQDPRTIYLNHEQSPKPTPEMGLAQERIDAAFRRKPRTTRNVADVERADGRGVRVCLLNGKYTGQLGVEERNVHLSGEEDAVPLRLTDLERTLIDIAVRPFYAGGVAEVLTTYTRAKARRASVNRLAGMVRKLGYVYPYHQAIGFYLEAAGYDEKVVDLFHQRFEYEFDFYLSYGMNDTEYVRRWRIHVPKGLSLSAP